MIIAGYAVFGLLTFLLALTDNLGIAIGLAFGSGIANMVFVIPSQTMFQERTPAALLGRVSRLPVRARLRLDDDGDGARAACWSRSCRRPPSSRPSGC